MAIAYIHESVKAQDQSKGQIIWLYGLSGSGKSTIAADLKAHFIKQGLNCFILDGDDLRTGINSDLGFSEQDREENLRRAAETAKLLSQTCDVVICTFITPFSSSRQNIHKIMENAHFHDFFINTPLFECERRDVKGLYKKARNGEISNFTGIDSPFDLPNKSERVIHTYQKSVNSCVKEIVSKFLIK